HQKANVEVTALSGSELAKLVIDPVFVIGSEHDAGGRPVEKVVALGVTDRADVSMRAVAVDFPGQRMTRSRVSDVLFLPRIPSVHGGGVGDIHAVLDDR